MTVQEAIAKYGPISGGHWSDETKHCTRISVPAPLSQTWMNSAMGTPTVHIYCNIDISQPLIRALDNVISRGLADQLKTFDGCYMVRDVRGIPGQPSTHSYACAIDLNAGTNLLGSDGDLSEELAQCFLDEGFIWGKHFSRKDPMHFSLAWET